MECCTSGHHCTLFKLINCEKIKTPEPLFISFSIVGNPKVPLSFKFETVLSLENKGLDCAGFDCASESHRFSKGSGWADVFKKISLFPVAVISLQFNAKSVS